MTIRAEFQKEYLYRYAIPAAACLLFALWFAYDGFIGYPKTLPMAEAYDELREIDDAEKRINQWRDLAEERGWSKDIPRKTAEEIHSDITGQYFWGFLNLAIGIVAGTFWLRSKGTWVESTEDGLTTSWGQTFSFADVEELNKSRWEKKGIARATYTEAGMKKSFVFDDFKYQRENLGKILRELEAILPREKISGGPTELENDAAKKEAAEKEAGEDAESPDTDASGTLTNSDASPEELNSRNN